MHELGWSFFRSFFLLSCAKQKKLGMKDSLSYHTYFSMMKKASMHGDGNEKESIEIRNGIHRMGTLIVSDSEDGSRGSLDVMAIFSIETFYRNSSEKWESHSVSLDFYTDERVGS